MSILDRFRSKQTRKRQSKYSLETIEAKSELISVLKEIIKAKSIVVQAYKTSLNEVIELETEGYTLKPDQPLTEGADMTQILQSFISSREDVPRILKDSITQYTNAHRTELNSVLNAKASEFLAKKEDKKEYGV